jgi:hypothetical protein
MWHRCVIAVPSQDMSQPWESQGDMCQCVVSMRHVGVTWPLSLCDGCNYEVMSTEMRYCFAVARATGRLPKTTPGSR